MTALFFLIALGVIHFLLPAIMFILGIVVLVCFASAAGILGWLLAHRRRSTPLGDHDV